MIPHFPPNSVPRVRQGPKVMIHVATATTATGATGGVLIPSGAGTEFPVLPAMVGYTPSANRILKIDDTPW